MNPLFKASPRQSPIQYLQN